MSGATAAIQNRRRSHESPSTVAPISVTVSRGSGGAQRRYPVATSAARSAGNDAFPVMSPAAANVGGSGGGEECNERRTKRTLGGSWTGNGRPGGAEEWNRKWKNEPMESTRKGETGGGTWFHQPVAASDRGNTHAGAQGEAGVRPVAHAARLATPPPMGEVGVRSAAPGGAGVVVREPSTGFSSGGRLGDDAGQHGGEVEGDGAEVRENVVKRLDFHTVFD